AAGLDDEAVGEVLRSGADDGERRAKLVAHTCDERRSLRVESTRSARGCEQEGDARDQETDNTYAEEKIAPSFVGDVQFDRSIAMGRTKEPHARGGARPFRARYGIRACPLVRPFGAEHSRLWCDVVALDERVVQLGEADVKE